MNTFYSNKNTVKQIITKSTFVMLFLFSIQPIFGQKADSLNTGFGPIGGINKLALEYYKIGFNKEQRSQIEGVEIEFIYNIDTLGHATLEKVNGVEDSSIIALFQATTDKKAKFYPFIENKRPVETIYFMKLRFPSYQLSSPIQIIQLPTKPKLEDFDYIHTSGRSIDAVIGANANSFLGNAQNYLGLGGGMKTEIMFMSEKGYGAGMVMNFYGNKLKKAFPIASNRAQNDDLPTLFWGIGLSKVFTDTRSKFVLQCELNYVIQNITPKLDDTDKDWVQFKGFSPSIVAHYMIQIGKSKFTFFPEPTLTNHYINFHAAFRPYFLNQKKANGTMLEVGLSYRLGYNYVKDYKLKSEKLLKNPSLKEYN